MERTSTEQREGATCKDTCDDWDYTNPDDLLAYETPKVVVIRDRRLGCLFYTICFTIILYVIGFQILYSNEHMAKKDVTGTSRLLIREPTKGNCDPDQEGCQSDFPSLESLPYCKEYMGELMLDQQYRKPCVFADAHSISPNGMLDEHILIPTLVESEVQDKGCSPNATNGHVCTGEYVSSGKKEAVYVADIENFMIHISHTYTRQESGASTEVQGYYLECEKGETEGLDEKAVHKSIYGTGELDCKGKVRRKPVSCLNKDCPFLGSFEASAAATPVATFGGEASAVFFQGPASWVKHGRRLGASLFSRAARSLSPDADVTNVNAAEKSTPHSDAKTRHGTHHGHNHHRSHKIMRSNRLEVDEAGHFIPEGNSAADEEELVDQAAGEMESEITKKSHVHNLGNIMHRDQKVLATAIQDPDSPEVKKAIFALPKAFAAGTPPPLLTPDETRQSGVWALPKADVFTLDKILSLCDLNLDSTRNSDGKTLREAGSVITIEAIYSNLHPFATSFGNVKVEYEYRVTRRPVESFGTEVYSQYQPNFPLQRILEQRKGIYVIVKIGGQFGTFSPTTLLILLATSAGLMRVANLIVDKIAMKLMKMRETYQHAKFDFTERVYDMQKDLDALHRSLAGFHDENDSQAGSAADSGAGADDGAGGARSSSNAAAAATQQEHADF